MRIWSLLSRRRKPELEPEGATEDWSPMQEIGEDPQVAHIITMYAMDPLSESDQEFARELLAMRERIDGAVARWAADLEKRLNEWAPDWIDSMPTVEWQLAA